MRYLLEGDIITVDTEYFDGIGNWLLVNPRLSNSIVRESWTKCSSM